MSNDSINRAAPARASEASATGAGAGLVSFSNNVKKENDLLLGAQTHHERLQKMRRAVLASAKAIHNDLLESGYQQWTDQSGAPWRAFCSRRPVLQLAGR